MMSKLFDWVMNMQSATPAIRNPNQSQGTNISKGLWNVPAENRRVMLYDFKYILLK